MRMKMLTILAGIRLALATIWEHKLRSVLTVLGVIIGTGTIIAVGSIIAGLDGAVTGVLRSFGANTVLVFRIPVGFGGGRDPSVFERKALNYEDALAIADRCPSVAHTSPYLFSFNFGQRGPQINIAKYKANDVYNADIGGTDEGYAVGNNVQMKEGRFFNDSENLHHVPVAVIGEDLPNALMGRGENPVGKTILVNGHEFQVLGVMNRPANSFPGQDDLRVLLPYFSMHKLFPNARENMIVVAAKEGRLPAAIDEVRAVLRLQRHVPLSKPDDFYLSTSEQMVEQFHNVTAMVALVMVVLSSIGLLVGGIGVMNIMLVSVTERTREIGIRKAIGARRFDIVLQFLTEAVVLTGLGGLIGMTFGWLISLLARAIFPSLPTAVPLWAAVLGFVVSVAVGLFFGIWPANKAARLDPVVALRYE